MKKVTIVVFSGEMDRAIAAFNIAIGAASMGMQATMFFTFWGLNILKRPRARVNPPGFIKKMLAAMMPAGPEKLPLSRLNMFGMGPMMMKKLMRQHRMPDVREMLTMAKQSGVKVIACTTTMELMGIPKELLGQEVDTCAGVASYLAEAGESAVNLFI